MSGNADPEKFDYPYCVVYGQLYHRVVPAMTLAVKRLTKEHEKACKERGLQRQEFPVSKKLKEEIAALYTSAATEWKSVPTMNGHASAVATLFANDYEKLRCVIMYHRFVMSIDKSDFPDGLQLTKAKITDELTRLKRINQSPPPSTLELWRTGCTHIGRPHTVAITGPTNSPVIFVLDSGNRQGAQTLKNHLFTTDNPMKGQEFKAIKRGLFDVERAAKTAKRPPPLSGFVAAISAVLSAIRELIHSMGDSDVDDPRNLAKNEQIYAKCATLQFIVGMVTCPCRGGPEGLTRSQADILENVEGCENFMLINRILMDPSALTRTEYYDLLQYHAKRVKGMTQNLQQVLPQMASALSYTDTLLWTMTIMSRIQPSLLSARANPNMRLFMHIDKRKEVEVEADEREDSGSDEEDDEDDESGDEEEDQEITAARLAPKCDLCSPFREMTIGTMNSQLRKDLPPTAMHDFWLTGYAGRTGFAALFEALGIDKNPEMCTFVRAWYGHSDVSWQYRNYAMACGRLRFCLLCENAESSVGCVCTGKRKRCKRAKKAA